jgi:hypothetical protein
MTPTLHSFATRVGEILHKDHSRAGRERVAALLSAALKDAAFMETLFDAGSPERKVLYEDPQLGFCILAHRYTDARKSPPHGHGGSWVIYGQLEGETVMSDWALVDGPTLDQPGKVKKLREYTLTPGLTHVYHEGELHAPSRTGPTRLVRIEGTNLERVPRVAYEPITTAE